jgi:hypothetical protein
MAAVYLHLVGQGVKFRADAVFKGGEISAWQVGAANTALKKHIATDE